jgi:hypothetical protein
LVGRALEEARRLPEVPPVPVNYSSLLASLRDWIEQLEATNADVAATRQELEHARGQNDAQKAAAVEDVFDPTWHRLAFLRRVRRARPPLPKVFLTCVRDLCAGF